MIVVTFNCGALDLVTQVILEAGDVLDLADGQLCVLRPVPQQHRHRVPLESTQVNHI